MTEFTLNEQLKKDTHSILACGDFHLLLHRNQSLPWFIVVPKTSAVEWFEMSQDLQIKLADLIRKLSLFLQTEFQCDKVNTASIGNVVSQLHVHVIGRSHNDPLWPDVVWGNTLPESIYSEQELQQWPIKLRHALESL
ncbi:HIT family protein [Marinicella rhabdoformis]|uniref:HIT family protein n=1 Tax=Marinicella rhabdoformis TaxID=2580566 RepID=UPI0012AEB843|nr:HIT family protein [Marinicella rhabdoformis]